jgi:RES domain-containing protein
MPSKLAIDVLPALSLFRIASRRHKIFDGTGAAIVGGRWNQIGLPTIYTSTSLAGAKLELLSHIGFDGLPKNYGFVEISVPKTILVEVYGGRSTPTYLKSMLWGSSWLRSGETLLARVPSAASPAEFNFIINPNQPDFHKITVSKERPAKWDSRHFT